MWLLYQEAVDTGFIIIIIIIIIMQRIIIAVQKIIYLN